MSMCFLNQFSDWTEVSQSWFWSLKSEQLVMFTEGARKQGRNQIKQKLRRTRQICRFSLIYPQESISFIPCKVNIQKYPQFMNVLSVGYLSTNCIFFIFKTNFALRDAADEMRVSVGGEKKDGKDVDRSGAKEKKSFSSPPAPPLSSSSSFFLFFFTSSPSFPSSGRGVRELEEGTETLISLCSEDVSTSLGWWNGGKMGRFEASTEGSGTEWRVGVRATKKKKKNRCSATAMLAWSYRKRTRYVVGCSGKTELLRNCKDGFSAGAKLDRLRYESRTVEKGWKLFQQNSEDIVKTM